MHGVLLTLHLPRGVRGVPVATCADRDLLRSFKRTVLHEWAVKADVAGDEVEAMLARLELDRLHRALDVLIPDPDEEIPSTAGEASA